MTSLRPYLVRALIDWIVDNDHTPHMVIDCSVPGVDAPGEYAGDGKLTLNISSKATRTLSVDEGGVRVDCRFRGRPVRVTAPVGAVVGVYAKETGMGMGFEADKSEPPPEPPATRSTAPDRPKLTLVK